MVVASTHPTEQLNAAIASHNPFDRPAAVRVGEVWGKEFPDVPSLNAHASDAVFKAIKQVSSGQGKVTSLAITAEKGVGKTHVISRIRHRLQVQDSALFIYASASRFSSLDLIKYQFLQTLSDSLNQVGSQGVKQWQELATALLNAATKPQASPKEMIEKRFPYALAKNPNLLEHLTAAVLKTKSHINPDIIRAILWTLSEPHAPYAINWLSGNELSEAKAAELGLANLDKEEREAKAFETVLQILSLSSDYRTVLICFDELETLNPNEASFPRPQIVAELVKNLFDSLNLASTSRGVVILTVMMPDTWKHKIKLLPGGIPDRVSSATTGPIDLKYMDGDSIVELVTLWLKEFYESKNLVFYPSVYPFKESQLRELAKYKPTVRQILQWCAKYFQVPGTPSTSDNNSKQTVSQPHPVEVAFNKELVTVEGTIDTLLEDKAALADALRLGFNAIIKLKQTIETVEIKRIEEAEPKGENKGYIDFKIVGKENGKIFKIGVAVLQQSYGGSLAAGLRRLIAYRTFGLTRGCLVRSEEKVISPTATQAQDSLSKLLSPKWGGKWVPLKVEAIKPLLAIRSVFLGREDYELSEEQIFDFIAHQKKLTVENYLIREILGVPFNPVPKPQDPVIVVHPDPKPPTPDSSWIQEIAKVGNSSDGHTFEKLVRKSLIELGFTNSNRKPETSLDPNATGGAGGLDFYCEAPYPVVGECKATKSEKVPDGTPAQLIKLGYKHLQEQYDHCIKLIVAAGELTPAAQLTASGNKINIIRPETLQSLVELQAKHKGSIDLLKLKHCLQQEPFGLADDKVNSCINKVKQDINLRSQVVQAVKLLSEPESEHQTVEIRVQYNAVFAKEPSSKLNDSAVHNLLIELSSPLTGYLGRIKGSDWQRDRFYFLRDLQIN
jgi:hypothetical protein